MAGYKLMFDLSSDWNEFLDESYKIAFKQNGGLDESECENITYCRSFGDITCEEGFKKLRDDGDADYQWLLWGALNIWHLISTDLQDILFESILKDEPASAMLYIKHTGLSNKQEKLAYDKFSKKMPIVKRALDNGSTKRDKFK